MTNSQPEDNNSANSQPTTQPTSESVTEDPAQTWNGETEEGSEASVSNGTSSSSTSYSFVSSFEEDILHIFGPECSFAPTPSSLKAYKLTGDNLDKNVKPTDYRVDSQTKFLHCFQTYAVRDRIDLSSYDDTPPVMDESNINTKTLLPSESDYEQLTSNFSHHVAHVLKQYMPFFSSFGSGLERHIRHQYYEEMSQKSEVVSCVFLKM